MTFAPQLTVNGLVDNGPISQYGFVDQVSSVQKKYVKLVHFAHIQYESVQIFL